MKNNIYAKYIFSPEERLILLRVLSYNVESNPFYIGVKIYSDTYWQSILGIEGVLFDQQRTKVYMSVNNAIYNFLHNQFDNQITNQYDTDQYNTILVYDVSNGYPLNQYLPEYIVIGPLNNVNYFNIGLFESLNLSLNCQYANRFFIPCNSHQILYFLDDEAQRIPNPFQHGNLTSNQYGPGFPSYFPYNLAPNKKRSDQPTIDIIMRLQDNNRFYDSKTGYWFVYKPSIYLSNSSYIAEENKNPYHCMDNYLFLALQSCENTNTPNYGIGRVKIPYTYITIKNDENNFDVYYYSLSSQQASDCPEEYAKYIYSWTVNSKLLMDVAFLENGSYYTYIFFIPFESYKQMVLKHSFDRQIDISLIPAMGNPPIIQWGNYTGYALCIPSVACYIRYKLVRESWKGNPNFLPCYPDAESNIPIPPGALDGFLPEIFIQYFPDDLSFQNSESIGIVKKNKPWPTLFASENIPSSP